MNTSAKQLTELIDALLAATNKCEQQLTEGNVAESHDWMFAIRESLYDLRRISGMLAQTLESGNDATQFRSQLSELVRTVIYEVIPHVQGHFVELEQSLWDQSGADNETPNKS